jgi:cell division protein FtsB
VSAVPARVATRPATKPTPRPQPTRAAPRRRSHKVQRSVRGGIVWIVALATLLAGVVAVNVAVLRQNMQLTSYSNDQAQLRDQNHALQTQLSHASSTPYIERIASKRLGLVQAGSTQMTYIQLDTGGK